MKSSGDVHPPEVEWDPADDIVLTRTRPEPHEDELTGDVAFLATRNPERPFWHRSSTMATVALVGLGAVIVSLLAGRRIAR